MKTTLFLPTAVRMLLRPRYAISWKEFERHRASYRKIFLSIFGKQASRQMEARRFRWSCFGEEGESPKKKESICNCVQQGSLSFAILFN